MILATLQWFLPWVVQGLWAFKYEMIKTDLPRLWPNPDCPWSPSWLFACRFKSVSGQEFSIFFFSLPEEFKFWIPDSVFCISAPKRKMKSSLSNKIHRFQLFSSHRGQDQQLLRPHSVTRYATEFVNKVSAVKIWQRFLKRPACQNNKKRQRVKTSFKNVSPSRIRTIWSNDHGLT